MWRTDSVVKSVTSSVVPLRSSKRPRAGDAADVITTRRACSNLTGSSRRERSLHLNHCHVLTRVAFNADFLSYAGLPVAYHEYLCKQSLVLYVS